MPAFAAETDAGGGRGPVEARRRGAAGAAGALDSADAVRLRARQPQADGAGGGGDGQAGDGAGEAAGGRADAAAVGELTMGVRPDPEADLPARSATWRRDDSTGRRSCERFGHRGPQEMELAQPRWSEDPTALDAARSVSEGSANPRSRCGLRRRLGSASPPRRNCPRRSGDPRSRELESLHAYLAPARDGQALPDERLRPDPPHPRRAGPPAPPERRHLLPDAGGIAAPGEGRGPVGSRSTSGGGGGQLALSLEVPPVLFSDDLEAIGRPVAVDGRRRDARRAAVGRRGRGAGAGAGAARRRGAPRRAVHPGLSLDRSGLGAAVRAGARGW